VWPKRKPLACDFVQDFSDIKFPFHRLVREASLPVLFARDVTEPVTGKELLVQPPIARPRPKRGISDTPKIACILLTTTNLLALASNRDGHELCDL
jgi:hypothetical protein